MQISIARISANFSSRVRAFPLTKGAEILKTFADSVAPGTTFLECVGKEVIACLNLGFEEGFEEGFDAVVNLVVASRCVLSLDSSTSPFACAFADEG